MNQIERKKPESPVIDIMGGDSRWDIKIHEYGLCSLVDVMPRMVPIGKSADFAIVQAARVSYGDGTKQVSEDRGLIRYLMRHRHCYDSETEVLTRRGFVCWPDVKPDDRLGIWDNTKLTLCYETPEYLTKHSYNGLMYHVNHLGVDLLVTPEHKMWVRTKKWNGNSMEWSEQRLVQASELGNRSMVRYCKTAPFIGDRWDGSNFPKTNDISALLELIGFFVGDGYAGGTRRNGIDFSLKKSRKIKYIEDLSTRLGWEIKKFPQYGGRTNICIYGEGITDLFRNQFYTGKYKTLPEWCFYLDKEDALSVLIGLRNSDGTDRRGTWEYSTSCKQLANQIQLLALHAGKASQVVKHGEDMFGVSIMSRMTDPVVNQNSVQTRLQEYNGEVFCAKTRTGILVVRRNGKIVLSGNTTPLEMVEFKFHHVMPIFIARQWIRHRTASVNEYSARYSVVKDRFYIPNVEGLRAQSKTNKQGGDEPMGEVEASSFLAALEEACIDAYDHYQVAISEGVSREQARMILPLNVYTEWYWKIDAHNLFHFLSLRMDKYAQQEIRDYANAMFALIQPIIPTACEAFLDYRLQGIQLSRLEIDAMQTRKSLETDNKREQEEWIAKKVRLGIES